MLKRLMDIVVSLGLLLLLSPLLLVIALAVWISSPGPILFRQQRLGRGERPFTILKFRTMVANAPAIGPPSTAEGDPRITRVGKILRKTSLDELPQLINVLRGDMSLIGPRPYVGFELENCSPEFRRQRASVRPGISGLAQVHGRSQLTADEAFAYDLEYVKRHGVFFDIRLILKTALAVLLPRNAT
jgi:lipopolysaccharide/colanic/teichoic acid biosynthesis glycosyltransferase